MRRFPAGTISIHCHWWAVRGLHLGRTALNAVQQLVFQLDANGQPVLVGGQPVAIQLRNCSTLTAANGDELVHTTIGDDQYREVD